MSKPDNDSRGRSLLDLSGFFIFNTESMRFLEKDLEQVIYETSNSILRKRNLLINGKKFRQVKLGNYGIADLITIHTKPETGVTQITLYELKLGKLSISAFFQAVRYLKAINRWISLSKYKNSSFLFQIVLIGEQPDNDLLYLPDLLNNEYSTDSFSFMMYSYDYKVDGIYFDNLNGFYLMDEGFKNIKK